MKKPADTPVLGFAAYSGTGKTTLLVKLLPLLTAQGIRTGVIKHAHHTFEIDQEGKDSYKLRKAGARQMLVGSEQRWALITETPRGKKNTLYDFLERMDQNDLDLILVEGFKPETIAKIEITRPALGNPLFFPEDKSIIAVATDASLPISTLLPVLDLNQPEAIAEFIIRQFVHKRQISTGT
jgi:molybdopterin-guanine dinucleotide biosynthesis protein MobB